MCIYLGNENAFCQKIMVFNKLDSYLIKINIAYNVRKSCWNIRIERNVIIRAG